VTARSQTVGPSGSTPARRSRCQGEDATATRSRSRSRRRSYRITPEGRAALSAWLAKPAAEPPQLRSLGLLKLFFAQHAGPGDIAELAWVRAELHRQAVDYTREIVARVQARGDLPGQLAVAELMGDALRVMGEHWERTARALAEPSAPAAAARGR
jgi:PadR family transcriptional regulator, regulatory protein AphA